LNRMLSKINYKIHTDSIKQNLIDGKILDNWKKGFKYANEADLLNIAVFGKTNKQWREETWINTKKKNIREYASLEELIILSNCEYLNSTLIERKLTPDERLNILRNEVEKQMRILLWNRAVESIKGDESFLNIHKSI
jgi:hypothetical protein